MATPTWEEEQWIQAVRGEDLESMKVILDGGFNINKKISNIIFNTGKRTCTGLHIAVAYTKWKSFMLLLEKGANVNVTDSRKQTPLIYTAWDGSDLMTQELIDHDADLNIQDSDGNTALIIACENGLTSVAATLIHSGADVYKRNKEGKNFYEIAPPETKKFLNKKFPKFYNMSKFDL